MANLGANFYPKLVQVSSEVGMKPEDLIAVMVSESGMDPGAVEKKFKGSGLVGFMPDTLKGLGFKGSWEDFSKLSGEEQLDWLKKLVNGYKSGNGGKSFNSAAQYYTANLWPVALQLPGVRQQNPGAAFIESNPETVTDPKTGKKWSKKYFDIGIKISPEMESNAYKYNPLFDRDKKGAITYGDMMKQVEINKRSPIYQKALVAMQSATNYTPGKGGPAMVQDKENEGLENKYLALTKQHTGGPTASPTSAPAQPTGESASWDAKLTSFLQQIAASEKSNKKLYKEFLPSNNITILVKANFTDAVEFSRVLCTALDEELLANAYTHVDGNDVEVQCVIPGPAQECFDAVAQLTFALTGAFKKATAKIGGIDVKAQFLMNKQSSYQKISLSTATTQYRKFLLKFI